MIEEISNHWLNLIDTILESKAKEMREELGNKRIDYLSSNQLNEDEIQGWNKALKVDDSILFFKK